MANYNRDQDEGYDRANQEWRESLNRRGEDIYGETDRDYYGQNRDPYRRSFSMPYARPKTRYHNLGRSDDQEYEKGSYYGNPTDYAGRGHPDSYRHLGDRRIEFAPGEWWSDDEPSRIGYRPDDERYEQQNNRGKGPRYYQRSDGRILEDINDRLYDDPFVDASDIEVNVSQGEVTLLGTVEDRHTKRRAEELGEAVSGVKNVENKLRVKEKYP